MTGLLTCHLPADQLGAIVAELEDGGADRQWAPPAVCCLCRKPLADGDRDHTGHAHSRCAVAELLDCELDRQALDELNFALDMAGNPWGDDGQ